MTERRRWLIVAVFAMAMAWMEAATVYYLRVLVDRVEPYQANPLPLVDGVAPVELAREAATLVMLLMVGVLSSRAWRHRLAYAAIAFGLWDIWYYVFLKMISGWPGSLFAWDVLFLLPLPWWGPVIAPVSIAALMIAWGTLVTQCRPADAASAPGGRVLWGLAGAGIALALFVFMWDSIQAVRQGLDLSAVLPATFNWPAFGLALALLALPVAHAGYCVLRPRQA
ncbi:MAG TPA: hypothetical protein VD833_19445 [Vicinamibacterales bacterium]|nr:hypothetical protein [Vicinamibacterales bacterium]